MKQVVRVGLLTVAGLVLASCGVVTEDVEAKPEESTQNIEVISEEDTQSIEVESDEVIESVEDESVGEGKIQIDYEPFRPSRHKFDTQSFAAKIETMDLDEALEQALVEDYLPTDLEPGSVITEYNGMPIEAHLYILNKEALDDGIKQMLDALSKTGDITPNHIQLLMTCVQELHTHILKGSLSLLVKKSEHIEWTEKVLAHLNDKYDLQLSSLSDIDGLEQEGLAEEISNYLLTWDVYSEYKDTHSMSTWMVKDAKGTVEEVRKKYYTYWKEHGGKDYTSTITGEELNEIHGTFNYMRMMRVLIENESSHMVIFHEDQEVYGELINYTVD